jgi:hypothetical protein
MSQLKETIGAICDPAREAYKHIDCEQGSERWIASRLGIPTASKFSCIVAPSGKPVGGEKRKTYMAELLMERLTGCAPDFFVSDAMERGTELEPEARRWYEEQSGNEVEEVGLIVSADGRCGASPDGLCLGGGVEIKCPTLNNQIKHLMADEVPAQWIVQIHGCMWLCDRICWDFVCYCDDPQIPSMIKRVDRSESMCNALDEHRYNLGERVKIDIDALCGINKTEAMILAEMETIDGSEL